jgi:putative solute:sodium symporter small subunit
MLSSLPNNTDEKTLMPRLSEEQARAYWRRNLTLMAKLLAIWFVVSFGCGILFVEQLNQIQLGGYKLGFWFAQQGSIYVFVALIFYYSRRMAALDREFGVDED